MKMWQISGHFRVLVRLKLLNRDFLAVPQAVSALESSMPPTVYDKELSEQVFWAIMKLTIR